MLALLAIFPAVASAATLTWDGEGATNNWSDCDNWTLNTCPVAGDVATFDGTSTKDATVDGAFGGEVTTLNISAGYTGTITLDRTLSISGNINQADGTLDANGNALTAAGRYVLTTGSFDAGDANISLGALWSTTSNTRSITMGSGQWTLTGSNISVWNTNNATNLTLLPSNNPIDVNYNGGAGSRTIDSAGLTESNAPDFHISAGSDSFGLGNGSRVGSLDLTGFTGVLYSGGAGRYIYGDLTLGAGMSFPAGSTHTTRMAATTGTSTITTNGVAFIGTLQMFGGATYALTDDLTVAKGGGGLFWITNGTFDAAGHNVTLDLALLSTGTGNRTLNMGSGTWTVGTDWYVTGSNHTANGETSTLTLLGEGGSDIFGDNTFYNLTFATTSAATLTFEAGKTQTVTGTLTLSGSNQNHVALRSSASGTQWNLNAQGTLDIANIDVQDSNNVSGTDILAYNFTHISDDGSNTGWIFKPGKAK